MTATGTIQPDVWPQYCDANGDPLDSYRIFWYESGSSTKQSAYSDAALGVALANPTTLNASGRIAAGGPFLVPGQAYKIVIAPPGSDDPPSSPYLTQDNVYAVPPGSSSADADVSGTAGETLAAGDCCYLSDGSGGATAGRWYKTDADQTYSSSAAQKIGFATAGISTGAAGTIRVAGRVTGLSGLVAGTLYLASATAGALTSTPPTNARIVAQADSTTSVVIIPGTAAGTSTLPGNISTAAQTIPGDKTLSGATTLTGGATFASGSSVKNFIYARCTSTLTKNNNSTLADVTGLAFAVGANETWVFQIYLYTITSSTANLKVTLTGPAAPTAVRFGLVRNANGGGVASQTAFASNLVIAGVGAAPSTDQGEVIHGLLRNGANAGTVQVQAAQNTNEVADTKVYVDSYLVAWRVE